MHLVTLVLATLSLGYCDDCNAPYPILPMCNKDTLKQIKNFYRIEGTPKHVFEKASEKGPYMIFSTSYDYSPKDITCAYLEFAKDNYNVTFVKNGITDYVLSYAVREKHGFYSGVRADNKLPEFRLNFFPILFEDDIFVYYVCGNLKGSSNASPSALILLSEEGARKAKNDKDGINKRITSMKHLLTKWCFDLTHEYPIDCFCNKTNKTCIAGDESPILRPLTE